LADAPNILLFVIDSQRASNLTVHGYGRHTTPHMESLAPEGMVFENHISTSPWCLGSYASLHTGKYPSSHGANMHFECLTTEFPTLAEILGRHEYQTVGLSCNSYISEAVELDRGFEQFEFFKATKGEDEDKGASEMERRACKWLDSADRERPFFMFVNCNEPHWPYWAPEPYRFLFLPEHDKDKEYIEQLPGRSQTRPDMNDDPLTPDDWKLVKGLYDGETAHADGALGAVIDALRSREILDNTLVIATSDHGEDQGEHMGFLTHAYHLYRTVLHIPLVIRLPGKVPAGQRYSGLTQPVDLFPTILTLAGLDDKEWHEGLQGTSLCPTFEGAQVREYAIAEYSSPLQKLERDLRFHQIPSRFVRKLHRYLKSIEDGQYKFIWSSDGNDQLFDLHADPMEENNIIEEQLEKAEELYRKLDEWLMDQPHRDYGDALNVHPIKDVKPENLKRLEAWGLLRRIHELPFGSGEHLSDTLGE